jgi:hypothetical protein
MRLFFSGTLALTLVIFAVFGVSQSPIGRPGAQSQLSTTPQALVPVVVDNGQIQQVNWFSDWNTCIWGIGVPSALAMRNPAKAKQIARNLFWGRGGYNGFAAVYGSKVANACIRFIRS